MTVRVFTPAGPVLERQVSRLSARGTHGHFTVLERHADWAAVLEPGLLFLDDEVLAADEGVLVKRGSEVRLAVRDLVQGVPVGDLHRTVAERYLALDDHERAARSALAVLEAGLLRRSVEAR